MGGSTQLNWNCDRLELKPHSAPMTTPGGTGPQQREEPLLRQLSWPHLTVGVGEHGGEEKQAQKEGEDGQKGSEGRGGVGGKVANAEVGLLAAVEAFTEGKVGEAGEVQLEASGMLRALSCLQPPPAYPLEWSEDDAGSSEAASAQPPGKGAAELSSGSVDTTLVTAAGPELSLLQQQQQQQGEGEQVAAARKPGLNSAPSLKKGAGLEGHAGAMKPHLLTYPALLSKAGQQMADRQAAEAVSQLKALLERQPSGTGASPRLRNRKPGSRAASLDIKVPPPTPQALGGRGADTGGRPHSSKLLQMLLRADVDDGRRGAESERGPGAAETAAGEDGVRRAASEPDVWRSAEWQPAAAAEEKEEQAAEEWPWVQDLASLRLVFTQPLPQAAAASDALEGGHSLRKLVTLPLRRPDAARRLPPELPPQPASDATLVEAAAVQGSAQPRRVGCGCMLPFAQRQAAGRTTPRPPRAQRRRWRMPAWGAASAAAVVGCCGPRGTAVLEDGQREAQESAESTEPTSPVASPELLQQAASAQRRPRGLAALLVGSPRRSNPSAPAAAAQLAAAEPETETAAAAAATPQEEDGAEPAVEAAALPSAVQVGLADGEDGQLFSPQSARSWRSHVGRLLQSLPIPLRSSSSKTAEPLKSSDAAPATGLLGVEVGSSDTEPAAPDSPGRRLSQEIGLEAIPEREEEDSAGSRSPPDAAEAVAAVAAVVAAAAAAGSRDGDASAGCSSWDAEEVRAEVDAALGRCSDAGEAPWQQQQKQAAAAVMLPAPSSAGGSSSVTAEAALPDREAAAPPPPPQLPPVQTGFDASSAEQSVDASSHGGWGLPSPPEEVKPVPDATASRWLSAEPSDSPTFWAAPPVHLETDGGLPSGERGGSTGAQVVEGSGSVGTGSSRADLDVEGAALPGSLASPMPALAPAPAPPPMESRIPLPPPLPSHRQLLGHQRPAAAQSAIPQPQPQPQLEVQAQLQQKLEDYRQLSLAQLAGELSEKIALLRQAQAAQNERVKMLRKEYEARVRAPLFPSKGLHAALAAPPPPAVPPSPPPPHPVTPRQGPARRRAAPANPSYLKSTEASRVYRREGHAMRQALRGRRPRPTARPNYVAPARCGAGTAAPPSPLAARNNY